MADSELSSDPGAILLGPGARPGLLVPLLGALIAPAGPRVKQLEDLGDLATETAAGGFLLLDADEVPLEDLGLVRRFLERVPANSWLLLLTGDDPSAPVARRLLARAAAATWLPWPVDVEELQALAQGASGSASESAGPPGPPEPGEPGAESDEPGAESDEPGPESLHAESPRTGAALTGTAGIGAPATADPERDEPPLSHAHRDDLERRLGRELSAIESILREEEGLLPGTGEPREGETSERAGRFAAGSPGGARPDTPADPLAGLELSREEIEAFLAPLEEPLGGPREGPVHETEEPRAEAQRAIEGSTATESPPEATGPAPETNDGDHAPPSWYRAQVADLADLAQGLGLSLHALREANEEEGDDAVAPRDEAVERLGGDVFRLIQFTRTLGFLAAPPGQGDQRLALATLVEEQLGGLAGSGPDSPRYLFRADDEVEVRCDKALMVQALDALLQVADACADATDVVRVGVHDGDELARVRIDFPAGPAAGVAPAHALQPYGLRRELPAIGPNALAAASRLFAGQGGRLSLGRGGPGRLVFEADLPKA